MSRKGRIGRILISDMMLQLLTGPLVSGLATADRGHSNDALESDDPSAGLRRACSTSYVDGFESLSSTARTVRDTAPHNHPRASLTGKITPVCARPCPDHVRLDGDYTRLPQGAWVQAASGPRLCR